MKMKLNLKQQKVNLDLSSRTILTKDHSKLLNLEAHISGHTGFVYDEDFVAYQEKAKTTADNLQTQIDNLDVGYITEEEMQQHLTEQTVVDKAQDDALNAEVTNREEADTTLQNNINTETKAREQGDSDLQTALSIEATERAKDDDTLHDLIETKQDKLVSGSNIKTINDQSIVGTGNISIAGGLFTLVGKDVDEFTIEKKNETYFITTTGYAKIYVSEKDSIYFNGSALVSTIGMRGIPNITINGVAHQLPRGKVTLLTTGWMMVYKKRLEQGEKE